MKRLFDFLLSLVLLVILAPVLLFIAVVVRWRLGSPVLFKQVRPGWQSKYFTVIKYRTMRNLKNQAGTLLPDNERLTPLGRFLRKTSLDELPQLFNVLKGEMSFVGPRPLLIDYLSLYNQRQARRHEVKPGITGWAQINGRNAISWSEKLELDVWYIEHQSLYLDLKILCMTIKNVLKRSDINQGINITMEKFNGLN